MGELEWITDRRRFSAIAEQWDVLAAQDRAPFLSPSWLEPWLDAFGRGAPLFAALWRGDALAAGLPLVRGGLQWKAPVNDHTPSFGLLAADADARQEVVRELVSSSRALTMPRLPNDEPVIPVLLDAARQAGRWTLTQPLEDSLVVDTSQTFDGYQAGLSGKVRSELGRLRRKAEREHTLEVKALEPPHALDAQLAQAFALEAAGWKGRGGTAISSSPQTERFYRAVARQFDARNELRLSELSLDGSIAATALSIIHGRRVFTLKVAYDERLRAVGPGLLLLIAMIERCFELGLEAYEFAGPPADYQRRFATGSRGHCCLRVYRRGPLNAARVAYHRRLRPALRSGYHAARSAAARLNARRTR